MEPKKPLTEVEPFNFNTEQRAEVHKTKEPALDEVCSLSCYFATVSKYCSLTSQIVLLPDPIFSENWFSH